MRFLELTLPTPAENLALDEALLLSAESGGGELLRLWEWPEPAVVLGSGCRLAEEVDVDACKAAGVPVLRRSSGGGTVLLGKGCLLFSLILDTERTPGLSDVRRSYATILSRVIRALLPEAKGAEVRGTSDLAIGERKFSGNAQQRKQRYILHHGTLLYGFDSGPVATYLKPPPRQPDYRAGRPHAEFLMNLALPMNELSFRLRREWETFDSLDTIPNDVVGRLTIEKHTNQDWIRQR